MKACKKIHTHLFRTKWTTHLAINDCNHPSHVQNHFDFFRQHGTNDVEWMPGLNLWFFCQGFYPTVVSIEMNGEQNSVSNTLFEKSSLTQWKVHGSVWMVIFNIRASENDSRLISQLLWTWNQEGSKYTLCKWIKTRPYRSFLQSLRRPPQLWKVYFKLTWMISWFGELMISWFGEFFSYIRQKYCMSCHWNDPRNSNLLTLDLDVTLTENLLETCSGYSRFHKHPKHLLSSILSPNWNR